MPQSLEEQFEERIKKLSADFEFFAHITSHDLRDPLRQARIYTDELLENIPEEFQKKLTSVNSMIDLVLEKISILRDFSYVANDISERTDVDLNKQVADVIAEFQPKITEAKAEIEVADLPIVSGNEQQLHRVFSVLIDNALSYRKSDVPLQVKISAVEENNMWKFSVADNGLGLEEVYRDLVFVLFQKLDTEPENLHFGAGLAFAKKIIENHGGTIWYKSDGESGTVFYFTLEEVKG